MLASSHWALKERRQHACRWKIRLQEFCTRSCWIRAFFYHQKSHHPLVFEWKDCRQYFNVHKQRYGEYCKLWKQRFEPKIPIKPAHFELTLHLIYGSDQVKIRLSIQNLSCLQTSVQSFHPRLLAALPWRNTDGTGLTNGAVRITATRWSVSTNNE